MALARRDDYLTDAQGRALAGAQVYYCTQPADVSLLPPSPLAATFSDLSGTPEANPQITDGFGHAIVYMDNGQLYTIVYVHPLFGPDPQYNNQPIIVLKDQSLGGGGGGTTIASFKGTPTGTIDGTNKTFTVVNGTIPLTTLPTQIEAWLNFPLIEGLGFALSLVGGQVKITYANAPQPASDGSPADAIYAQGYTLL